MKILIIGNLGYVGPALVRHLRQVHPSAELIGYDCGWFSHCLTTKGPVPEVLLDKQLYGDVREFSPELLSGVDAVVNLAAVSNDPMGNRFEGVTDQINQQSCINIAKLASEAGVKNFIFASSCSVYGSAGEAPRKEEDTLNPLTAYARSKILAEENLAKLSPSKMVITCLRFATACGMSDRLRLDLVLNDFVACAISQKLITVLSDGSPWRPLIHVNDMAKAIDWAISRETANGGQFLVVNAGSDRWNYQVKDLAKAVATMVPGTEVNINQDAPPDKRSYKVDFSLFKKLAPNHQSSVSLQDAIGGLLDGLKQIDFSDENFRNSERIRLRVLNGFIENGKLSDDLLWVEKKLVK
jgi:nucleoside-diphosphate-sugar epimerase